MRKWKVAIFAAVAAILAATVFLVSNPSEKGLSYGGMSIDYWFAQLPVTMPTSKGVLIGQQLATAGQSYGSSNSASEVLAAFDTFGTNAVDYLLWRLQHDDSILEEKARKMAVGRGVKFPARDSHFERGQAVTGLVLLRQLPVDASNQLARLSTNAEPDVARAATYVLQARQGNGRELLRSRFK